MGYVRLVWPSFCDSRKSWRYFQPISWRQKISMPFKNVTIVEFKTAITLEFLIANTFWSQQYTSSTINPFCNLKICHTAFTLYDYHAVSTDQSIYASVQKRFLIATDSLYNTLVLIEDQNTNLSYDAGKRLCFHYIIFLSFFNDLLITTKFS